MNADARLARVVRQSLRAKGVELAPAHRADVPVDSCADITDRACVVCIEMPPTAHGKHRADLGWA